MAEQKIVPCTSKKSCKGKMIAVCCGTVSYERAVFEDGTLGKPSEDEVSDRFLAHVMCDLCGHEPLMDPGIYLQSLSSKQKEKV